MSIINKIQYISNLYKYDLNKCHIKPNKPYLAMCGNIGDASKKEFTSFIDSTCQDFEKVLFVPGVREYTNMPKTEADLYFNSLQKHNQNFTFMNNKTHQIDDTLVIGSIMWPNVSIMSSMYDNLMLNMKIDDEHYITPRTIKILHQECEAFIKQSLSDNKNKECLVISHFCPSLVMNSDNQNSYIPTLVKNNYACDLESILKPPLTIWISGVIDDCIEYEINNIKLLCNNKVENT